MPIKEALCGSYTNREMVIPEELGGVVSPTTTCLHSPQVGQGTQSLSGERLPLSQGDRSLGLVCLTVDEAAVLIEVVVEGGIDGAEPL